MSILPNISAIANATQEHAAEPLQIGIISMPASHGPALRVHGRVEPTGALLITFDRSRLTPGLVVTVLRERLGARFEYTTAFMPETGRR